MPISKTRMLIYFKTGGNITIFSDAENTWWQESSRRAHNSLSYAV